MEKKPKNPAQWIQHYRERMRLNRKSFMVYSVLRALVIATAVRCVFSGNYESLMLCILSLLLFLLPSFFEERLKIQIPPVFEATIYLFIYAAEILGEVNKYYTTIPGWDTMLHTLNGFLCAAIGFSLIDILNRSNKRISLSPAYLTLVAFCFSMTIGVLWEFVEFTADQLFYLDMQKDFIVNGIASVTLDPTQSQIPYHITGITKTLIETSSGQVYTVEGGYLDIGIIDTMKDLLVNFVGAVVFSVFGYLYVRNRDTKSGWQSELAGKMMLHSLSEEDIQKQEEDLERIRKKKVARKSSRRRRKKK